MGGKAQKWFQCSIFLLAFGFVCESFGQSDSPLCLEICLKQRQNALREFRNCTSFAEKIPDSKKRSKKEKICEKRYPIPLCQNLFPCDEIPKVTSQEAKEISALELIPFQRKGNQNKEGNRFFPGQVIWLRYELPLGDFRGSDLWFDQKLEIFDELSKKVFDKKEAFPLGKTLVSSYQFKSHFKIPKRLKKGKYSLKISLSEKSTHWETIKKVDFSVVE